MPDVVKREHKAELKLRTLKSGRMWTEPRLMKLRAVAPVAADGDTPVAAKAKRPYRISVSSEVPVLRWDYYGDPYYEVLGHSEQEADVERFKAGGSLRDEHWGKQVGSVANPGIEDGECWVDTGFMSSQRGKELEDGVNEGHIQNVSLGYDVIGPAVPSGHAADGIPIYRFAWSAYHVAIVPDPADFMVGYGRSSDNGVTAERTFAVRTTGDSPREEREMRFGPKLNGQGGDQPGGGGGNGNGNGDGQRAAAAGGGNVVVLEDHRRAWQAADRERRAGIEYVCGLAGIDPEKTRAYCDSEITVEDVSKELRAARKTNGGAIGGGFEDTAQLRDQGLGLSEKDARRYSFSRAVRMSASMHPGAGDFKREEFNGLEREVHDEVARFIPANVVRHAAGVFVPWRLRDCEKSGARERARYERALMARTMGATVATGGAELVPEVMGELIDMLRPATVLYRSGARVISGLSAPVSYPVKTQGLTAYWTSENPPSPIPWSEMKFGTRQLSPRTIGVRDLLPYQLLVQSSIDMESESRADMVSAVGETLDLGGINGPGTSGQVLGILNTPGVGETDDIGGVGEFKDYLNATAQVATATKQNNLGERSWLATVEYASALAGTPREAGTGVYLWPTDPGSIDESTLCGYRARSTTQMPTNLGDGEDEHGMLYGPFGQCVFGLFGAVQIIADPFTLAGYGQLAMTYLQLADFLCRRPEAFVKVKGAKPA